MSKNMTEHSRSLGVEITRENSEIVDDIMDYRGEKVESDADFRSSYHASVIGAGNPAEDAFYNAFSRSKIKLTPTPDESFETAENLAMAIKTIKNAEVGLGAKVNGIREHAPVIQTGMEALEEAGFEPYAEITKEETYEGSVTEVVNQLEDDGAILDVWAREDPVNDHPDSHYVVARYHPNSQTLEPDSQVCSPSEGTEEETEEINYLMGEALDEVGLLH